MNHNDVFLSIISGRGHRFVFTFIKHLCMLWMCLHIIQFSPSFVNNHNSNHNHHAFFVATAAAFTLDNIPEDYDLSQDFSFPDEYRPIDGYGNNVVHPIWGSAPSPVMRCVPNDYADGFNAMASNNRPNPREISNVLCDSSPDEADPIFINARNLTQFAWQWGQFIDHDITLIADDRASTDINQNIDILTPCCDDEYDSECKCDADIFISMKRTLINEDGDGSDLNNIRKQTNSITSYIDASTVYGSDFERANELRALFDGLLLTSQRFGVDFLPFNIHGFPNELTARTDFFLGGDIRSNENPGLTTIHTMFVRLHNLIAAQLKRNVAMDDKNASQADEDIYEMTRAIVIAIIQKITYVDWLPVFFGESMFAEKIGYEYAGYDADVNVGVCTVFSSAAYRVGHTMVPFQIPLRKRNCKHFYKTDDLPLFESFFRPDIMQTRPSFMEALITGYACTKCNEIDVFVTSSLRNLLFHSAEDAALPQDLVSFNIQRGREHGLPDYNTVRSAFGLEPISSFDDLSENAEMNRKFKNLYHFDVNNIDILLGALAEPHMAGSNFGALIATIVGEQFQKFRAGDRFYFQNYLRGDLLAAVMRVELLDVIEWTTEVNMGELRALLDASGNLFKNERAVSVFEGEYPRAKPTPKRPAPPTRRPPRGKPVKAGKIKKVKITKNTGVLSLTAADKAAAPAPRIAE